MSQDEHQRSQVRQGLQRFGHANDALDVGGVETALGAVFELDDPLVAIHRIRDRAPVMTACFAEHASVRQPDSGHSPGVGRISRNVGIALDAHFLQDRLHARRESLGVAEGVDIDAPVGNCHRAAIGEIELAIETARGRTFVA